MSTLYGRRYTLTATAGSQRKSWSDLDLAFRITKTITADPNEMELTLWGLSADSRALLFSRSVQIQLEAGYQEEYGVIFSGQIVDIQDDGAFPDLPVVIRASDGRTLRSAPMQLSVSGGMSGKDVLSSVLAATGLKAADSALTQVKTLSRGMAMLASPATILDAITRAQGLSWSVQDGELHVLPATGSSVVVVVSEPVGKLSRRTDQGRTLYTFRTLLRAPLRPGVQVRVSGVQLVVQSVEHTGEAPGQSWYSDVEGLLR